MALRWHNIKIDGMIISVGLRLVKTPYRGYIVEFRGSTALMELKDESVVLRTAYGKWDVDILKIVKDYIKSLNTI